MAQDYGGTKNGQAIVQAVNSVESIHVLRCRSTTLRQVHSERLRGLLSIFLLREGRSVRQFFIATSLDNLQKD